jgi:AcrR family transcriptional regulator
VNVTYIITFVNGAFMKYGAAVTGNHRSVLAADGPDPGDRPPVVPAVGRPRSERARLAILEAAADLLVEGGLGIATIESIAARAGVSKVTIYKWWPSRGAVAVDAYFHRYRETYAFTDTGDVATDLAAQMRLLVAAFRGRAGEVMAELIGQAQVDPALAETLRTGWLRPRREATATVLRLAVDRGQIRAGVDIETAMDQLYGPVYWRLIMGHQPLDGSLVDELVRNTLEGIRPR